ncbi:MAG: hypothetical protein JWO38_209 [Gemmataceae bacterium]|nr:hypothetical protein [Gemmataceae bacterium]
MRAKLLGAVVGVFGFAASAAAQFQNPNGQQGYGQGYGGGYSQTPYAQNPSINPANVMPNIYNPQYQPLSPYLNLNRTGNPAVNYYYGVRPGTIGGAAGIGGSPMVSMGGNRALFFPQLATGPDPLAPLGSDPAAVLPPAGHAVAFGNTLGFFPGTGAGRGMRTGLSGVGNRGGSSSGSTPRR